jgi:hypothetical protein
MTHWQRTEFRGLLATAGSVLHATEHFTIAIYRVSTCKQHAYRITHRMELNKIPSAAEAAHDEHEHSDR